MLGLGLRVLCLGLEVQDLELRVQALNVNIVNPKLRALISKDGCLAYDAVSLICYGSRVPTCKAAAAVWGVNLWV